MTETQSNFGKEAVREHFSASTGCYEREAGVQRRTARRLAASLEPWKLTLPSGPVLELGAGTGFYSRELAALFPGRTLDVTDLSPEMIRACKASVSPEADNVTFRVLDAEEWEPPAGRYALVTGNFVAQWFSEPAYTLERYLHALKPGGLLLMAFPGHESFPEWRSACREVGIPWTGNPMPVTEELVIKLSMGPARVDYYEDSDTTRYQGSLEFFRHLKRIGASASRSGKQLTPSQFWRLITHWDRKSGPEISITYHLIFLAVKRDL
ncbi:MAG: methyltransferase domain-containing protein [Balneolaceae bacterium]